jgi:hypothetical protein
MEFCAKFVDVERREGLFRRELGGVRYWHLIRYWLFNDLVLPHYMSGGVMHPDDLAEARPPETLAGRVKVRAAHVLGRLRDLTVCSPDVAFRPRRVLFMMTPRMAAMEDGREGTVMLDFVAPLLKSSYALWEHGRPCGYTRQPFSRKVFHLPYLRQRRAVVLAPSGRFAADAPRRRAEAEALSDIFCRAYGFPFESGRVWWMIDEVLRFREIYYPLYRRWLRRLGVRALVLSVPEVHNSAIMTEAAHELGIPVVELQHGTVYPEHMVYSLGERGSVYSPDYFLAWGEHWAGQLTNYPNIAVVSVGYPYLDHFAQVCPRRQRGHGEPLRVLFVSQGGIGADMSRMALELSRRLRPEKCRVVYKMHPNESMTWRSLYPHLAGSGVEVVSNDDKNIYQCLSDADVTVGTNSTALVEGFMWGVPALVLRFFLAAETMGEYCKAGLAEFVDSEEALYAKVRAMANGGVPIDTTQFKASRFWVPNAAENVASFIDALAEGKSPPGFARTPRGVEPAFSDESHETT